MSWKSLARNNFSKRQVGLSSDFSVQDVQMFEDMSSKGIILEDAYVGTLSEDMISRNYISFSLPISSVKQIVDRLKTFNVLFIVTSSNKDAKISFNDANIIYDISGKHGIIVMYLGGDVILTDLNTINSSLWNEHVKVVRKNIFSVDLHLVKIDKDYYESMNQYSINEIRRQKILDDQKLNDISVNIIEKRTATITVIDAEWPNSHNEELFYVFDLIKDILPENVDDFNVNAEWYCSCFNESDPILLESFDNLNEKDVVRIFLGELEKGECYITIELIRYFNNKDLIMRNWVQLSRNKAIDSSGYGGEPGSIKYYKLPLTGSWITESTAKQIRQRPKILRLKIKIRNQLIGNRYGSFGRSEIHGQSPGETIWEISSFIDHVRKQISSEDNEFIQISLGRYHSIALRVNGSLVSWGDENLTLDTPIENDFIQISAGNSYSIALRRDGTLISWGDDDDIVSDTPKGSDFTKISAGNYHCIALRKNGSVVSWGDDTYGQVSNTPRDNDFIQISAGGSNSIAIRRDRSLVSWGDDTYGQVSNTPRGNDFIQISAGGSNSIAIRRDRSLVSWGRGESKLVSDTPKGNDFTQISMSKFNSIVLKRDGSLISWGNNRYKQVSDTPKGDDFVQVSAGFMNFAAIRKDGTLVGWGDIVTINMSEL